MITIKGNILAVKQGFVCHQVSCKGKLTSKLSNSIAKTWPRFLIDYVSVYKRGGLELGEVLFTTVCTNKLYIATLYAQGNSNKIDGRRLDYPALGCCLRKVKDWYDFVGLKRLPIYMPWKIGCSEAGGDWETVRVIIKREIPNAIMIKL